MFEKIESAGQAPAHIEDPQTNSSSPSSQVPTIVVFTQSDKKVDSLLTPLLPANYSKLDVERLQPVAEAKAQEHCRRLENAFVARGLSKDRFAVLGGLALPHGGSNMYGS